MWGYTTCLPLSEAYINCRWLVDRALLLVLHLAGVRAV